MVYKVQELVRDVRKAIDQNRSSEQLLEHGDVDTLSLEEIVGSKIEEAVRRVESTAPAVFLEEGHTFGDAVYWCERESGYVLLPDDFMRLVAFRMSDWERTVYAAISAADAAYEKQSSRYKGIRGDVQKPVCAIVNRAEGKALEFYSCASEEAYVSAAAYRPYPKIDDHGGIDISERCYTAVVYMAAALVLTACGESERSQIFTELAKTIFQ